MLFEERERGNERGKLGSLLAIFLPNILRGWGFSEIIQVRQPIDRRAQGLFLFPHILRSFVLVDGVVV
jgi:hypothetical protein